MKRRCLFLSLSVSICGLTASTNVIAAAKLALCYHAARAALCFVVPQTEHRVSGPHAT